MVAGTRHGVKLHVRCPSCICCHFVPCWEKLLEVQLFLLKRLNCPIKLDEWPLPSLSFCDLDILLALPRAWLATPKRKGERNVSNLCCNFTKNSLSRKRLRGGSVVWDTALQAERSRVRFPIHGLNPSGRTMAVGSTPHVTEMSKRGTSSG